jgi:hypothetical protein
VRRVVEGGAAHGVADKQRVSSAVAMLENGLTGRCEPASADNLAGLVLAAREQHCTRPQGRTFVQALHDQLSMYRSVVKAAGG